MENEAKLSPPICRKMKSEWVKDSLAVNHFEGREVEQRCSLQMPSKLSYGKGLFVLSVYRKENPGWVRFQQSENHQEAELSLLSRNLILTGGRGVFIVYQAIC